MYVCVCVCVCVLVCVCVCVLVSVIMCIRVYVSGNMRMLVRTIVIFSRVTFEHAYDYDFIFV